MGELREAVTDDDLDRFARIRLAASPRSTPSPPMREPDRLILLHDDDGCGLAARSSLADSVTVQVYVRPEAQGAGIGTAIAQRLLEHARGMGRPSLFATVDGAQPYGIAFAQGHGLVEVGREVESRRTIGEEPWPDPLPGIDVVTVAQRPELLEAAWYAVGQDGYEDIPAPSEIAMTLELWLEEEAAVPEGSFVALEDGRVVAYAGMLEEEHGLTTVARSHRGRGLATHLKRCQLAWAASSGVPELVSYTQGINDPMRAVNDKLGYAVEDPWLKMKGPVPPA